MIDLHQPPLGEFLLYQTDDGRIRVECRFANETLWLSQAAMADLFQTTKQNIAKHLKAIFAEGELVLDSVVNHWLTTANDGKSYLVSYYNLEAILAVGYRVRSVRGTQFRRWATERLGEYLLKGFTMDDERLKNPPVAGSVMPDYFAPPRSQQENGRVVFASFCWRIRPRKRLTNTVDCIVWTHLECTCYCVQLTNRLC